MCPFRNSKKKAEFANTLKDVHCRFQKYHTFDFIDMLGKNEWRYVRLEIPNAIKEMNPTFLDQIKRRNSKSDEANPWRVITIRS